LFATGMKTLTTLILTLAFAACLNAEDSHLARRKPLEGAFGTYDGEPRLPNGRIHTQELLSELTELRANTYNFLIWHAKTDWDDLQKFLPLAREKQIKVWVTLVPPTESPPLYGETYSEPFRLDFKRWEVEIAKLSLQQPNLVAWSLDDFSDNVAVAHTFTPEQWKEILSAARAINPKLAFVPCCYFQHLTREVAAHYRELIDGVLFPYMHAAKGMNLTDTDTMELEVHQFKNLFGKDMPVFVDIYASRHTSLNETTPEYIARAMRAGKKASDGVLIYTHPNKQQAAKFASVKKVFHEWAGTPSDKSEK
jgi:hypothetical protein